MDEPYAAVCGITEEEMLERMLGHIECLAGALEMTCEETRLKLKEKYDGYHFTWPSPDIYNPFSLPVPFRFSEPGSGRGVCTFPVPFYANVNKVESPFEIQKFVREVRFGDYDSFFRRLQSFFANTTYEVIREQELHYENVFFIVFKLVGFYTQVEYHTSKGRIDLVLQTDKLIYVMEFKLDGTAEEALQQIHDKHYALPFASDRRKLFKIGVNFSAETRNIEKWIVEE